MSPSGYPDENTIAIEALASPGTRVQITLRDSGPGMSEELVERVFDPFVTTRASSGGTGLGLFVCHGIITSAGGQIDVESRPGKGTTFRIHLPSGDP
jgi:signal transduction histidine kinase